MNTDERRYVICFIRVYLYSSAAIDLALGTSVPKPIQPVESQSLVLPHLPPGMDSPREAGCSQGFLAQENLSMRFDTAVPLAGAK